MNTGVHIVFLLFAALVVGFSFAEGPSHEEVSWLTDLSTARQGALETGRPLLVVFR